MVDATSLLGTISVSPRSSQVPGENRCINLKSWRKHSW
jgi:hypothetical protein